MIERVGVGTVSKVTSGDVTPGLPAGLEVDDILLYFACCIGGFVLMDAAWVWDPAMPSEEFYTTQSLGGAVIPRAEPSWLRYDGTTPPTAMAYSGSDVAAAWIVAYRGCEVEGAPFDMVPILYDLVGVPKYETLGLMWAATSATTTITYPAMTPNFVGSMVVCPWFAAGVGENGPIMGDDPAMVPVLDDSTALGSTMSFGFSDGISTDAMPIPQRTSTFSLSATNLGAICLLKPKDATGILSPTAQYDVSRHLPGATE